MGDFMFVQRWILLGICLAAVSILSGCGANGSSAGGVVVPDPPEIPPTGVLPAVETVPLSIADDQVSLSPENTLIQFRGAHIDKTKADHLGAFETFTGTIAFNAEKDPQSIEVEIDAASLFTANDKLTAHLKNADFLDVNEHPQIKFVSKSIEYTPYQSDSKRFHVIGDLTLHGVTAEVEFPIWLKLADDKLTLTCDFTIDRTQFGMDYGADQVDKEVALKIIVGEKTRRPEGASGG